MKRFFSGLVSIGILFFGCGIAHFSTDEKTKIAEEEHMEENIVMTEKEKELLGAIYADTERIQEGKLFSHQEEALWELRAGMQYLAEKYPEENLQIVTFEPATKFNSSGNALFQSSTDVTYLLSITPKEDSYECADTYYGTILREAYDKRIGEILVDSGISALVFTEFPIPMGLEINGQTSVDTLIDMKSELARNTSIFIEMPAEKEETATVIKDCLINANLYGAYMLYFVPSIQGVDVAELQEQRSSFEKKVFQCFDVK